jgi:CheY-like chemotaxis protein
MGDDAAQGKGFIAISISDAGTGMTEEVRKRALEPFFTTKEIGRGTGLGLSTVYGFARQSHGALTIDSSIGVGTTVTLYIPQAAAGEPSGNADGRDPIPIPPGLRVLLVEDDSEVRTVITTFLQSFGCETAAAANAEQALLIQDSEPAFDLLLSDISLGTGMRGTELAAHMQQRAPSVAILLMSGFSSELIEADRDMPQSWELLPKPCTRQELAAAITRVLTIRNPPPAL